MPESLNGSLTSPNGKPTSDSPSLPLRCGGSGEQSTTPEHTTMQSIQSRYIPASNVHGSRIKAWCDRGSVTVSYPHELSGDAVHRFAVDALIAKFNAEDAKQYGPASITPGRGWNAPYATGQLPGGDYAHVFVPMEMRTSRVISEIYANAAESPEWIRHRLAPLIAEPVTP